MTLEDNGIESMRCAVRRYMAGMPEGKCRHHAALIDMDGVLYDSMKYHTLAWWRMMSELGVACTREEFYLYEGMTGAETINLLFRRQFNRDCEPERIKELYELKTRYFSRLGRKEPMPGASNMLDVV